MQRLGLKIHNLDGESKVLDRKCTTKIISEKVKFWT